MADYEQILERLYTHLRPMAPANTSLDEDTDLVSGLGLDSVNVMDLLLEIEEDFDISVPLNLLADIRTLSDLAHAIARLVEKG
ncbi:MAG: acyl carrier protein [Nitrococcus sp.]|nr:acyl carrier protein [Nitrococcus sp.]